MQIEMAMAPGQVNPGGWGTLNTIPDAAYVRGDLTVIPSFKPSIGFVQRYQVPAGVQIQVGRIGPQFERRNILYPGCIAGGDLELFGSGKTQSNRTAEAKFLMLVDDFSWTTNAVRWRTDDGEERSREYVEPIRNAVVLSDRSGIGIIEALSAKVESNAVVLNADGSVRFRLTLPRSGGDVYGFDQIYYVVDELTAILAVTGHDFAYVVDERNGAYLRYYETR